MEPRILVQKFDRTPRLDRQVLNLGSVLLEGLVGLYHRKLFRRSDRRYQRDDSRNKHELDVLEKHKFKLLLKV